MFNQKKKKKKKKKMQLLVIWDLLAEQRTNFMLS